MHSLRPSSCALHNASAPSRIAVSVRRTRTKWVHIRASSSDPASPARPTASSPPNVQKDGAADPKASSKQAVEELKQVHKWARASASATEAGFADVQASLAKLHAVLQQPSAMAIVQTLQWAYDNTSKEAYTFDCGIFTQLDVGPELRHILRAFMQRRGACLLWPGAFFKSSSDADFAQYRKQLAELVHGLTAFMPRVEVHADGCFVMYHGAYGADDATSEPVPVPGRPITHAAATSKPAPPRPGDVTSPADTVAAAAQWYDTHVELQLRSVKMVTETRGVMILAPKAGGDNVLSIHIGEPETQALMRHTGARREPGGRPMTHDLLANAIAACNGRVARVDMHEMTGGTYFAHVHVVVGGSGSGAGGSGKATGGHAVVAGNAFDVKTTVLDARPSDAVNLAVRCGAPLYATKKVMDLKACPEV